MTGELESLIRELEDCAVTGTPGSATWKRNKVRQLVGKIVQAALPPGIQAWKLDLVADCVSLLDRMDLDLDAQTVTVRKEPKGETDMEDDLRKWAEHMRDPFIRVWAPQEEKDETWDS